LANSSRIVPKANARVAGSGSFAFLSASAILVNMAEPSGSTSRRWKRSTNCFQRSKPTADFEPLVGNASTSMTEKVTPKIHSHSLGCMPRGLAVAAIFLRSSNALNWASQVVRSGGFLGSERRKSEAQVDFDGNGDRVDAVQRRRPDRGQHARRSCKERGSACRCRSARKGGGLVEATPCSTCFLRRAPAVSSAGIATRCVARPSGLPSSGQCRDVYRRPSGLLSSG